MISALVCTILAVVIAGPKAFGNILTGTHNYSDGFSVGYKKESEKYKQEQYNKQ